MHLEQIFLERSYHVATLDYEMEEIHRHSINFIKSKIKLS
jgi:esterase/lipase